MYSWLKDETGPKMIVEAVKLLGTTEDESSKSNKVILEWAEEVGVQALYTNDDIPWCGLFIAVVALRSGKKIVQNPLWAKNWTKFGTPAEDAMLGDVLVFQRNGGGHVGLYVGEDHRYFHILGGNQGNQVNIMRILKTRCISVRRPLYHNTPYNVRKIVLSASGKISSNEE